MALKKNFPFLSKKAFFFTHYGVKRYVIARFFSRLTDIFLILLLQMLVLKKIEPEITFYSLFGYFTLYSFFHGQTLGRTLFGISYQTENYSFFRHFFREVCFWLFFGFAVLELIFSTHPFFHDRWFRVVVVPKF